MITTPSKRRQRISSVLLPSLFPNLMRWCLGAIVICLLGCGSQSSRIKLTIAAAANVQYAMKELTEAFTASTSIDCQIVVSSSGKLTAQIVEGAPYDVLVSADMKYPKAIQMAGLAVSEPRVYAYGSLVLWSNKEDLVPSLGDLSNPSIKHIAIANPKTAPYGSAALEVLKQLEHFDLVKPKLVFGESISQVNQFVHSQTAEIGFTAEAVVRAEIMNNMGSFMVIDKTKYTPIAQGMVAIKSTQEQEVKAKLFCEFLLSTSAKDILSRYGYDVR